jgi:hypothetical protein
MLKIGKTIFLIAVIAIVICLLISYKDRGEDIVFFYAMLIPGTISFLSLLVACIEKKDRKYRITFFVLASVGLVITLLMFLCYIYLLALANAF